MAIDRDRITKLLTVVGERDALKLKILDNAAVSCRNDYNKKTTSAHLKDWQKAEEALEEFCDQLEGLRNHDRRTIKNILAVVDHLSAQGWKVKKSAVYNHKKEGKLRPQADGSFRLADVERYAETFLKRQDGSASGNLDKFQEKKLAAETRKAEAQADLSEMKARAASGSWVPKTDHERDLARRAALFRTDLETFARSEASEIVDLVSGDAGKIPELVTWLLARFDGFLANYSAERAFVVPLLQADSDAIDDSDDEDEEGD